MTFSNLAKSLVLGAALGLAGCGGGDGTFSLADLDLPRPNLPQSPVQYAAPISLPTVQGRMTGLAAGNFDASGSVCLATLLGQIPGQLPNVNQLEIFPSAGTNFAVTSPLSLLNAQSLGTTPSGDLISASASILGNNYGLNRFKTPLSAGPYLSGPFDTQNAAPFPSAVLSDARLASFQVGSVNMVAVPGVFPGPVSGVAIFSTVSLELASIPTSFIDTGSSGITTPGGLVAGDFNGDGFTDLAVQGNGTVLVYLQQASAPGTFTLSASLPLASAATDLAAGFIDGGGSADLVVSTVKGFEVYLNGNFTQAADTAILPLADEMNIADLNGDGHPDLYGIFGSPGNRRFFVGVGAGDGTFRVGQSAVGDTASTELRDVIAVHYSGQGAIDLAALLRNIDLASPSGNIIVVPISFTN
jgi:hypothetical protein